MKTPINNQGTEYSLVAGVFEADDDNAWAQTAYGTLLIPRVNIGPYVMFLADDFDLSTLNSDTVLVVNE